MKFIFNIGIILLIYSCSSENNSQKGIKIARVNEAILYETDFIDEIPDGLSSQDSLNFTNQYVKSWITEQLVLQKAEELLPEQTKTIKKKLEKYRTSLLSYEYEQIYIQKRLDTLVNSNEIAEYYNNHKDDFILKDYIIKCMYLKINKDTPDQKEIKTAYLLKNDDDETTLRTFAQNNAIEFYYNTEEWIYFDDLLKKLPIQDFNKRRYIEKKKKLIFEENDFIYYLNIYDYRLEDGTSPLSFEKEKIKSIILNMRSNELRRKLRDNLLEDALKNESIENFLNE